MEQTFIAYLLGELSEDEEIALEQSFFADSEVYERLLAVEEELSHRYAVGDLTRNERAAFERRFLSIPERMETVKLSQAVAAHVAQLDEQRTFNIPQRVRGSFFESFFSGDWFGIRLPAFRFSTALIVGVLFLGLFGSAKLSMSTFDARNPSVRADIPPTGHPETDPELSHSERQYFGNSPFKARDPFLEEFQAGESSGKPPAVDPFVNPDEPEAAPPSLEERSRILSERPRSRPPEPSEKYLLSEIELTGILRSGQGYRALFRSKASNERFSVQVGSKLWDGEVVSIETVPQSTLKRGAPTGKVVFVRGTERVEVPYNPVYGE